MRSNPKQVIILIDEYVKGNKLCQAFKSKTGDYSN